MKNGCLPVRGCNHTTEFRHMTSHVALRPFGVSHNPGYYVRVGYIRFFFTVNCALGWLCSISVSIITVWVGIPYSSGTTKLQARTQIQTGCWGGKHVINVVNVHTGNNLFSFASFRFLVCLITFLSLKFKQYKTL